MSSDPSDTRPRLGWLTVALAWLAAASFLLRHGFPRGTDWMLELVRLAEWRQALGEGQMPPAWAPDLYGGFGSPVFLFYPPLASALAAGASVLLPSLQAAAVAASLVTLLIVIAGAAAMEDGAPRIAALVLVLQPYLLADLLLRNAQAELLALALLPLAMAGLLRADRRPRQAALLLALAVALVSLTHPLTALMLMVILIAGGAFVLRRSAGWGALAAGMGLGLLLSAWSWLPALVLGSWIRHGELLRDRLDFHRNFLAPHQLIGHGHPFSAGWLGPAALLCLLGALLAGRLSGVRRRMALAVLVGGAALLALRLPLARPVWQAVPWMPLLQFPWRLMGPLAVLAALAAALAFGAPHRFPERADAEGAGDRRAGARPARRPAGIAGRPAAAQGRAGAEPRAGRRPRPWTPGHGVRRVSAGGRRSGPVARGLPRTAGGSARRCSLPGGAGHGVFGGGGGGISGRHRRGLRPLVLPRLDGHGGWRRGGGFAGSARGPGGAGTGGPAPRGRALPAAGDPEGRRLALRFSGLAGCVWLVVKSIHGRTASAH